MRQDNKNIINNIQDVSAWALAAYYLSWFWILVIGGIVVIKIMGGVWVDLTSRLDIFLLLFALFDFIIFNRWIRKRQLKRDRGLFLLIITLFLINTFWYFSVIFYSQVGVYHFQIALNYLLIILPLPLLVSARRAAARLSSAIKIYNHGIEPDQRSAETAERQRRTDFPNKFPKISARPIGRIFFRWMYTEGWIYSTGIILIFLFGLILRIYKLGYLSPAGDEYRHLLALKHFVADGYFEYHFSQFVTFLIIAINKLTGTDSIFLFRLPFVLFGGASILLLYGIGRRISKFAGLVAAYLFAFLPIAVGLSRYIRGYEIETFTVLLAMFVFLTGRFRKKPMLNFGLMAFVLILLNYLNSDARYDAATYFFIMFSGLYTLIEFVYKRIAAPSRKIVIPLLLIFGFFAAFFLITRFTGFKTFQNLEPRYLYVFNYVNSDATWFFAEVPWLVVALVLIASQLNRKRSIFSLCLLFIGTVIMLFCLFYFSAPRRFQVRYIYYIFPYVILLLASGLDFIGDLFKRIWPRKTALFWTVACVIFLAVVFGPWKAVYFTLTAENGQNNPVNDLAYFDNEKLVRYINERGIDVSQALTTSPWVLSYHFNLPFLRTPEEKKQYIHSPLDFELLDRERIYSVSGYWDESDIRIIKQLIEGAAEIKYLIMHAAPKNEGPQFQPDYLPSVLPKLELIGTIDADKTFGYYIYRVRPELKPVSDEPVSPAVDIRIPESTS